MNNIFSFIGAVITFIGAVVGISSGDLMVFCIGVINIFGFIFFINELNSKRLKK